MSKATRAAQAAAWEGRGHPVTSRSSHVIVNDELRQLCADAGRVKAFCDAFGIEFRGFEPLVGLLQGADKSGLALQELVEDPDNRPYIWDLKE